MTEMGQSRPKSDVRVTSASLIGRLGSSAFRPFHNCGVDVARGLVLLYGLGTRALPSWDSKTRWNNLYRGLAVGRSKRTCELTSSIVPLGTISTLGGARISSYRICS